TKTASLRWHSRMLGNISAVRGFSGRHMLIPRPPSFLFSVNTWDKVNAGMMYKAEVLGKAPVTQHSLFGSTLPY
ncbi:hypothetical protein EDD15DRAFT_2303118, partial [Pisolithus albus]